MGGFELKLWRKSMELTQEQAAVALGVELRTYWNWEKNGCTTLVELATKALSMQKLWPDVAKQLKQLSTIARH